MTLVELLDSTQTTLHDAYLHGCYLDYKRAIIRFELDIWVGARIWPEGTGEESEAYELASLTISGLYYFVQQAPNTPDNTEPPYIDDFVTRPEDIIECKLPAVGESVFRHSIFVGDWNSFIHFAGTGAELVFSGVRTVGPSK